MLPEQIIARLVFRHFGSPIIQNDVRGALVEEIIASALEPDWTLCSAGWAAWDLESSNGLRIQVKNSSARQSWKGKPSTGNFIIAPATGFYKDGVEWIDQPGRDAEIYVFAWHPVIDEAADHRDPTQWRFFVVDARELPDQRSISRTVVEKRWKSVGYPELAAKVETMAADISKEANATHTWIYRRPPMP